MLEVLEKYYNNGYLIKQTHPTLPLTIWNYSQTTQYEQFWDEITLQTRGLVTDEKGNIVALAFDKFFNIEENKHTPTESFQVFEKMDGSLGILFNYNSEWIFSSRGSFTSDQAVMFEKIFKSKYDLSKLNPKYTYIFEIIFESNRIVVDYNGIEDVFLLGKRCPSTKTEYSVEKYTGDFNVVKKYDGYTDYTLLKNIITNNQEGFVILFSNGSRCKIKGEEYIRLHKIMTQISTTSVWEVLSNGDSMESIISNVPDEFYSKIKQYELELTSEFTQLKTKILKEYVKINLILGNTNNKTFALYIQDNKYKSFLFQLRNSKSIDFSIWKMIKPKYKPL